MCIGIVAILAVIVCATHLADNHLQIANIFAPGRYSNQKYSERKSVPIALASLGAVIEGLIVAYAAPPLFAFSVIYYAESRRLRLILKEFRKLMFVQPFQYNSVAHKYLEMHEEWDEINQRMGPVAGVALAVMAFAFLGAFITTLYGADQNFGYALLPINAVASMFIFLPPLLLVLFAMIQANQRAEEIAAAAVWLVARSGLASGRRPAAPEASALLSAAPREEPGAGPSADDPTLANVHSGLDSMKMQLLAEKAPCELRIFGTKFTGRGVVSALSVLVFTQLLVVFGFQRTSQ
jgi:hypothetical protein